MANPEYARERGVNHILAEKKVLASLYSFHFIYQRELALKHWFMLLFGLAMAILNDHRVIVSYYEAIIGHYVVIMG